MLPQVCYNYYTDKRIWSAGLKQLNRTIYSRLILDVDRYHDTHDIDLRRQLRHVSLQLLSTAPTEFSTTNSIWNFLLLNKYNVVLNETFRPIIDSAINEHSQKARLTNGNHHLINF